MLFTSDNWTGAHPRIGAALAAHAQGSVPGYGKGPLDVAVAQTFSRIFEREAAVFFVSTGTAANSLALTLLNKPGGIAFGHRESHVREDECGAPEYFTGGARLYAIDGAEGRMDPAALERALARFDPDFVHGGRPMAVTITQATEAGTVYGLDRIAEIGAVAARHRLPLHMDGARFANALVALDTTPAGMTWKRGVDILSFGGTKNGCWCAEAVVLFDPAQAREFAFIQKRAGQLFSKSRFVAAQFAAYFEDGLWLETARHANAMAARLAQGIAGSARARLAWIPQANEVFAILRDDAFEAAGQAGARFYEWPLPAGFDAIGEGERLCRLVTSFATRPDEVDAFLDHMR
jgi:threonine aldolase